MISTINENIYDVALISKIKKQTGSQKLREIINNLRSLSKEEVKNFYELKIKIFEEEKENIKKPVYKISAPIIRIQHYIEDFKKLNLKSAINNNDDREEENTPSTVDNEEEFKQIDSSDFSEDE